MHRYQKPQSRGECREYLGKTADQVRSWPVFTTLVLLLFILFPVPASALIQWFTAGGIDYLGFSIIPNAVYVQTDIQAGSFSLALRPQYPGARDSRIYTFHSDVGGDSGAGRGTNFIIRKYTSAVNAAEFNLNISASDCPSGEEAWQRAATMETDRPHPQLPFNYDQPGSFSLDNLLDVIPVSLESGNFRFHLNITGLTPNDNSEDAILHFYLFHATDSWQNNGDSLLEFELTGAAGEEQTADFTVLPGEEGDYFVVIVNDSSYYNFNDPRPFGTYSVRVERVATPELMPDLLVDSISTGSPAANTQFTIGFQVKNSGDAQAAASSANVEINGNMVCAAVNIAALQPGDTGYGSCLVDELAAGTHSATVCADAGQAVSESDEQNNCSTVSFIVQAPYTPRPDLVVSSISPATGYEGQAIAVQGWIVNHGEADAAASLASVSVDGTVVCNNSLNVDPVAPWTGQLSDPCNVGSLSRGDHDVEVCINSSHAVTESDYTNNCTTRTLTIDQAPRADLVVEDITPLDVIEHQEFSLLVKVKNQGNLDAPQCQGQFILDQTMYWAATIPAIPIGESRTLTLREGSGWNPGSFLLSFRADSTYLVDETREYNNTLAVTILVRPRTAVVYPDGHGAYPTIQAAIDSVAPGGTVQLVAGTYRGEGNRDLDFHGRNINLIGADQINTTIDCESGTQSHIAFILAHQEESVLIRNIRVINGGNEFFGGALYASGSVKAAIQSCIFSGNFANTGGAVEARNGAQLLFSNCRFLDNSANTTGPGGGAIHATSAELQIQGSLFQENTGSALVLNHATVQVQETTFFANDQGIYLSGPDNKLEMERVIISDSSGKAMNSPDGAALLQISCTDIYGNAGGDWETAPDPGLGQISQDPLYCDPSLGKLTLAKDSPCVDNSCGLMGAFPVGCGSALDTDNDGLDDDWERTYFGNLDHDTYEDADGDNLTNFEEFQYGTDPTRDDTDHDGMTDGWEVYYQLDPLVDDAFADVDGDLACNLREFTAQTNPADGTSVPSATTIHVSVTAIGNPVQNGSDQFPFATIQQGVDMAAPGDTVSVGNGTYLGAGNRNISISGEKDLVLLSSGGPAQAVIDCERADRCVTVNSGTASLLLRGFTIRNGQTNWGGGLYIRSRPGNVEVRNCRFEDNEANLGGGAVAVYGTTALFRGCTFTRSLAHKDGGAFHVELSDITFRDCEFTENHSAVNADGDYGAGGGLYAHQGSRVRLISTTFNTNIADASGGAVAMDVSALGLVSTSFRGNSAGTDGGALFGTSIGDGAVLANALFQDNHADQNGGALYLADTDSLQLVNCTLDRNSADLSGGPGVLFNCAGARVLNSIIQGVGGNDFFKLDSTALVSSYTDLFQTTYSITNGGSISFGTGSKGDDPQLSWDGHPAATSPCRNSGSNAALPPDFLDLDEDGNLAEPLPLDLDGSPRIQSAGESVDMGAFEYGRGLMAVYSSGETVLEGPIRHGYSHDCTETGNNLYQDMCTPVDRSPANWAWGDFSVTWSGCVYVPVSGTYTFSSRYWVDGTVYVAVNGETIADFDTGGAGYSGQVTLEGAQWVPISASFAANSGSNSMVLGWRIPGQDWSLIPRKYLGSGEICNPAASRGFLPSIYMLLLQK